MISMILLCCADQNFLHSTDYIYGKFSRQLKLNYLIFVLSVKIDTDALFVIVGLLTLTSRVCRCVMIYFNTTFHMPRSCGSL